MEKIQPLNSYVAIRLPNITKDKIKFLDGEIELVQKLHEREKELAISYGEIIALPENDFDIHNHFSDADNDLKVGDKAFFDQGYTAVHGRITKRVEADGFGLLVDDDENVILIPSRAIIMVERDGNYIAQNEFVVGHLIEMPTSKFAIKTETYKDRIKVVSSPSNVRYRKIFKGDTSFKVEAGEIAVSRGNDVLRITNEYEADNLYVLKQRQIIGKIV